MSENPWNEKLDDFRSRLEREPDNGLLWIEYGDFVREQNENPEKVIYAYERARDLLPNNDMRLRLGAAYAEAERFEEGVSLIKESLAEHPRSHGFCKLADVYFQYYMYADAKDACEKAIELDDAFEEAYYLMGKAVRHESHEQAIRYFKEAISRDHEYHLAWRALGSSLAADDTKLQEAIEALRQAITLDPEDGWSKVYLANIFWRMDKYDDADRWYREAIDTYPDLDDVKRWYQEFLDERKSLDTVSAQQKSGTDPSTSRLQQFAEIEKTQIVFWRRGRYGNGVVVRPLPLSLLEIWKFLVGCWIFRRRHYEKLRYSPGALVSVAQVAILLLEAQENRFAEIRPWMDSFTCTCTRTIRCWMAVIGSATSSIRPKNTVAAPSPSLTTGICSARRVSIGQRSRRGSSPMVSVSIATSLP